MCCTGRNRKRNLSPKEKFTSKRIKPSQKRVISAEEKYRSRRARSIPSGPVARPLGRPRLTGVPSESAVQPTVVPVRWRSMPITMLVEYTGSKRKAFTVEGYEFSKDNRVQAVDVADVGELLKRPDFRGKK